MKKLMRKKTGALTYINLYEAAQGLGVVTETRLAAYGGEVSTRESEAMLMEEALELYDERDGEGERDAQDQSQLMFERRNHYNGMRYA